MKKLGFTAVLAAFSTGALVAAVTAFLLGGLVVALAAEGLLS